MSRNLKARLKLLRTSRKTGRSTKGEDYILHVLQKEAAEKGDPFSPVINDH